MTAAARIPAPAMDIEQFLSFIDTRPDQELWDLIEGQPTLMTRPTVRHGLIVGNLLRALDGAARPHGCRVLGDVLVCGEDRTDMALAPDVSVHCGPLRGDDRVLKAPSIIVEVLSPSTMHWDRGVKFAHYQSMPPVSQIMLVYQDQVRIESWTRMATAGEAGTPQIDASQSGSWDLKTATALEASVTLPALRANLPLLLVYQDIPDMPA